MTQLPDSQLNLLRKLQERAARYTEDVEALDAAWIQVSERVVGMWINGWGSGAPRVRVRSELDRKFRVCFSLAAHALNCVNAALNLRTTLPWVACACARVAFEHALTAQWVLLTEGGEDALVAEISKKGATRAGIFADAVNKLAREDPACAQHELTEDEVAALVGEKPKSGWSVEQLCDRFSNTKLFYDMFRGLSGAAHPSTASIAAHWTRTDTGELVKLDVNGSAGYVDELAHALAISALWALYVLEVMRAGESQAAEVRALGEAAALPVDLRPSDQHPERQPKTAVY